MKIALQFAMPSELHALPGARELAPLETVSGVPIFEIAPDILACAGGVSKVNAAMAAELLCLRYGVDLILNAGVAGCFTDLPTGTLVVASEFVQHDVDTTAVGDPIGLVSTVNQVAFPTWQPERCAELLASLGYPAVTGRVSTGDWFAVKGQRAEWIRDTFSPLLTEMEGGAIAQVCLRNGVRFVSVKSVSDHLFSDSQAEEYFDFGQALADHLRQRMKQEMGLTLSVGVSFNKVFAKLGSDYRKPDATTVVSRENWQRLVWPLPVGALLYVGGAARKILAQFGVKTIGELAACKRDALETLMGKMGVQLHDYANGLDTDPVRSRYEPEMVKSVGNGTTFPKNLTTAEQVRGGVAVLADSVATRLRHSGLYAGGVQVTVRDPQFHDRSRQMQLSAPTHLIRELTAAAMDLTGQLWKPPAPVRALTVTAIHLVRSEDAYEQVDLFTAGAAPKKEKQEKLEAAMDRLRGKFGTDVISYGAARPEKEEDPLP